MMDAPRMGSHEFWVSSGRMLEGGFMRVWVVKWRWRGVAWLRALWNAMA